MTSKRQKRLRKKAHLKHIYHDQAPNTPRTHTRPPAGQHSARPTPERMRQGTWASPQGMGKDMQPMVDLASDMIGALYNSGKINTSQEQAARLFQELRAGYLAELGTKGYGSCLADNQTGHDDSDGDERVIKAYRHLEDKIGRVKIACLTIECDKGPTQKPNDLGVLHRALDGVAR